MAGDDLEVRREIEVLMHSVYAGDHIAVERIAEQMSFIARARLRTVLCTYSLTIWHPITYGPLWFLKL